MLETEKKLFFVEVYLIALNLNIVIFCAIYVTVEVFTFFTGDVFHHHSTTKPSLPDRGRSAGITHVYLRPQ